MKLLFAIIDPTLGIALARIIDWIMPNPMSGWLVLIPERDVTFLEMSVEDGLKYIISGGVVVPPWTGGVGGDPSGAVTEPEPVRS